MPAPRKPETPPRLKCSNEQCEFLASLDTEKMGSFCCKKCHLHFSRGVRKLKHGEKCKQEPAPPELERAPVVEPKEPIDWQGVASSKPAKKKWNEQNGGRCEAWNEPVDETLDGIWSDRKMTEEDLRHMQDQQENQIQNMRLTLRNPTRPRASSEMTDASSSKTTDREENGRDTRRRSRPRAPQSEHSWRLQRDSGISRKPIRAHVHRLPHEDHQRAGRAFKATGSRSRSLRSRSRQRPNPYSFPTNPPADDLEDGECSPSRPRSRSRAFPRGTVGRMLRATSSRHQDLGTTQELPAPRRRCERMRRRHHEPRTADSRSPSPVHSRRGRPIQPKHPESLQTSHPRDDQDGEWEGNATRAAASRSPSPVHSTSGRATASRLHKRRAVASHTRVGSETESVDSEWTVKTSYTVFQDEILPGQKPCERYERVADEGSRKSTEMRSSAGQADAEALGLSQLPPREPASLESMWHDGREEVTRPNEGVRRSHSRDDRAPARGGPREGSSCTGHFKETQERCTERYGSDHPRDGHDRVRRGAGDAHRRRSEERHLRARFDAFRSSAKEETRPCHEGKHREPQRARELSTNTAGTQTVDREPVHDSRGAHHRRQAGNSANRRQTREASVESKYSYYSHEYYSSSEDPAPCSRADDVQQGEKRQSDLIKDK